MRILLIGGTGRISMAISRRLLAQGEDLYLINRGSRNHDLAALLPDGRWNRPTFIVSDVNDEAGTAAQLEEVIAAGRARSAAGIRSAAANGSSRPYFDAVADFIAFGPEQLERDFRLFAGKTRQFLYISTASAYQTPPADYLITESTPLYNPFWDYSQRKIEGETYIMERYRKDDFPVTIVRPSHTFDERSVPVGLHGDNGSWQTLQRMLEGKPVIIPGDGNSLWTLTFNEDFAVGFTGLLGNPHAIGQAVHITSPESMTWNQIHEIIADELGVPLQAVHISTDFLAGAAEGLYDYRGSLWGDKSQNVVFDISKLRRLVPEFCPQSMERRLRATVRNVASHPEFQTADPVFDAWCDRVIAAREAALESLRRQESRRRPEFGM